MSSVVVRFRRAVCRRVRHRWGTEWKKANVDWYAHSFGLSIQGSCYPHTENFLDLDPVYKDAYGQPLVRMTFDWRDNETKMSAYVTKKMEAIAKGMGPTSWAGGTAQEPV